MSLFKKVSLQERAHMTNKPHHIAHVPFVAICGADEPGQSTVQDNDDSADCLACFRVKVKRQRIYIDALERELSSRPMKP